MPIYEYQCPACGHTFEVFRRVSDSPDGACPRCETQGKRVFSPVGVIFKGSGFYTTDYKNRNGKPSSSGQSATPDTKPGEAKTTPGESTQKKDSPGSDAKPDGSAGSSN